MKIERIPILRITEEGEANTETTVTTELPLTIILNNRELVTLLCSPTDLEYLAVGFLATKGWAKVESQVVIAPHEVFELVNEFQRHSQLFQATHGVHSAALCDTKNILVFNDDLGRHNAIDKIFGECILKDIPTDDRIVITTGRVPSEQLIKVAKRNVPIMISLTVPTDLGVKLAADFGITLIGSVKGKRMNVYTNKWRVVAK